MQLQQTCSRSGSDSDKREVFMECKWSADWRTQWWEIFRFWIYHGHQYFLSAFWIFSPTSTVTFSPKTLSNSQQLQVEAAVSAVAVWRRVIRTPGGWTLMGRKQRERDSLRMFLFVHLLHLLVLHQENNAECWSVWCPRCDSSEQFCSVSSVSEWISCCRLSSPSPQLRRANRSVTLHEVPLVQHPFPVAGSEPHEWVLVVETKQKPFPEWNATTSVPATEAVYRNQYTGTNQGSGVTTLIADFTARQQCDQTIFTPCFAPSRHLAPLTTADTFDGYHVCTDGTAHPATVLLTQPSAGVPWG